MTERRYQDDEVREIFGLATRGRTAEPVAGSAADGLTLADIQDIGLQVGLDPGAVATAAASLDARTRALPRRTSFGMPIEVGRIVPLPRPFTDSEWEQVVAELRSTFRARGKLTSHGAMKEWANGNLHACVEQTDAGYRLRLGTLKDDAVAVNLLGAASIATAIAFAAVLSSGGANPLYGPTLIGGLGVAAFLSNILRLPRWAKRREQQMAHIAGKVNLIVGSTPTN